MLNSQIVVGVGYQIGWSAWDILFGGDKVSEVVGAPGFGSLHAGGTSEMAFGRTDTEQAATLYHEFLKRLASLTGSGGVSRKEVADQLELTNSQVDAWIRRDWMRPGHQAG